jgi:hypothetical protein
MTGRPLSPGSTTRATATGKADTSTHNTLRSTESALHRML